MDMERAIETQRLRLLRLLAGLLVAIGFLSVGPVSRGFSDWACGFVGSVLSRAEAAARCLVIAQARLIAERMGSGIDRSLFSMPAIHDFSDSDTDVSLSDLHRRLCALRALLSNLPRHALRLLRRIEKRKQGGALTDRRLPRFDPSISAALHPARRAGNRIERPPDPCGNARLCPSPPSGFRAGGASGSAVFDAA